MIDAIKPRHRRRPGAPIRRLISALALLVSVAAIAGCGASGASNSDNAAATGTRSTATTTVTRTEAASSPSTTSYSQTIHTVAPCTAANLALRFLGQQGATGHGELGFAVRNTGAAACQTYGYPGVQFLSDTGALLPTRTQRTTTDFFGSTPVAAIVIAPGASASFRLGVSHGDASTAGCTTAHGLQVFPPNDTATLRTTISQGAYECGTATVSPMRPDTSAFSS